ncbi:MAG TPA: hypothetical protein VMZ26_11200 [Pyrinomonadaceae bacterium]|nr:hypothetical protein [Pyrinomonadaceae bacterium]
MDWDSMDGDERKRFCSDCKLNVYNLSSMTRYDAEHLLRMSEGRLCVRYFQRADGTILTQNCPVGWARVKQRASIFAAAAFSLVVSLLGGIFMISSFRGRDTQVLGTVAYPSPTPKTVPLMGVMGNVAKPTPTPTPRGEVLRETLGKREIARAN